MSSLRLAVPTLTVQHHACMHMSTCLSIDSLHCCAGWNNHPATFEPPHCAASAVV
jgi:hypothetical protein